MAYKTNGVYISSWRLAAQEAISNALEIADSQGLDEEATWKAVGKAYPFGTRSHHPYKIWLSEIKLAKFNRLKARGMVHTQAQARLFWVTSKKGLSGNKPNQT